MRNMLRRAVASGRVYKGRINGAAAVVLPDNNLVSRIVSTGASELKERREASARANSEFNRVKEEKLESERRKSQRYHINIYDEKTEKQLDRERANRASAAASRAKIVCYARELEKRTDRLEMESNAYALSSHKATKKLQTVKDETHKLKQVLRHLWELKDPKTLLESPPISSSSAIISTCNAQVPHGV